MEPTQQQPQPPPLRPLVACPPCRTPGATDDNVCPTSSFAFPTATTTVGTATPTQQHVSPTATTPTTALLPPTTIVPSGHTPAASGELHNHHYQQQQQHHFGSPQSAQRSDCGDENPATTSVVVVSPNGALSPTVVGGDSSSCPQGGGAASGNDTAHMIECLHVTNISSEKFGDSLSPLGHRHHPGNFYNCSHQPKKKSRSRSNEESPLAAAHRNSSDASFMSTSSTATATTTSSTSTATVFTVAGDQSTSSIPSGLQSIYALAQSTNNNNNATTIVTLGPEVRQKHAQVPTRTTCVPGHRRTSASMPLHLDDLPAPLSPDGAAAASFGASLNSMLPVPSFSGRRMLEEQQQLQLEHDQYRLQMQLLHNLNNQQDDKNKNFGEDEEGFSTATEKERHMLLEHLEKSRDFDDFDV